MRSWGAFALFFAVMTLVVGGVHYYLYARLARAPGLEAWQRIGAVVFGAGAILMPAGMILSRVLSRPLSTVLATVTFSWMGLVVLLFFLTLGSEVFRGGAALLELTRVVPDDPERRAFMARAMSGAIGVAAVGLGGYGAARARSPIVKELSVSLSRFPSALDGLKIVQLTDVHIGPLIDGAWLRDVVARVNELSPDVIAITGDLVDGSVAELRDHVAPLADLKAKHGVYFVTGNHEYYSGVDEWIAELTRLGIRVLRNERVSIGDGDASFDLAGIDDYRAKGFGGDHGPDLVRALAGRDADREIVLLAHQPKHAFEAAEHGVGLQLSGHTHGGQIWPWGYMVRLDQTFVAGLDRLKDTQIYTSCGTGYWGPPMRVGAPPEITLLTLSRG
ncbi:MAG: metallophosphoesterase [Myxococcales bacterium]|nr:metallophosphoesterase [Myxococcales bacterium]